MQHSFAIALTIIAGCGKPMIEASPVGPNRDAVPVDLRPIELTTDDGRRIPAELGRFRVPERRRAGGHGRTIELAFVRFRSTARRPGVPIVYLAGGPGAGGSEHARGPRLELLMALRAVADVIAFDQRGTGLSQRLPPCPSRWTIPLDEPVTGERLDSIVEQHARECAERWRADGVDLGAYNTEENADDIDDLRRALGASQIALVGASYGSHLGLAVIRRHRASVARAVLAGVEGPDSTEKLPSDQEALLRELAARVAADPEASRAFPTFLEDLREVLDRLGREPAIVDDHGRAPAAVEDHRPLAAGEPQGRAHAVGDSHGRAPAAADPGGRAPAAVEDHRPLAAGDPAGRAHAVEDHRPLAAGDPAGRAHAVEDHRPLAAGDHGDGSARRVRIAITQLDVARAIAGALRGPQTQRWVPLAVAEMRRGDMSSMIAQMAALRSDGLDAMPAAMDAASGVSAARAARIRAERGATLLGDAIDVPDAAIRAGLSVADLGDEFRLPVRSDVPVLLISGTLDGRTPPRTAEEVRIGFPHSTHMIVDGAGHGDDLYLASPVIAATIVAFLRGEPTSDRTIAVMPPRFVLSRGGE